MWIWPMTVPWLLLSGLGTEIVALSRFVAAFGSLLDGFSSRSSVLQYLVFGVVTHPEEEGEPGTFMTIAPSPASVKKQPGLLYPEQISRADVKIVVGLPADPTGK